MPSIDRLRAARAPPQSTGTMPTRCFQPPGTYLRRPRARQPALSSAWSCAASTARGSCAAAVDVRHVKLSRVRASSRPTDSSAELLGSLPRRATAADRARVAPNLIYPCLGAARHDPANSHSIESRLSQTCTAHSTRSSAFRLGHLEVSNPWRRALPSYPYADATSRSAPPIFAPNCALSCSGRSRGARDTPRRGRLAAAIASITCRKVGLGRVSHGAALCGSQVASRPYTSTLRIKVSV